MLVPLTEIQIDSLWWKDKFTFTPMCFEMLLEYLPKEVIEVSWKFRLELL